MTKTENAQIGNRTYIVRVAGFQAACNKCGGSGLYDLPTPIKDQNGRPFCLKCNGSGVSGPVITREQAEKRSARLEKAQAKRDADRQAKREADRIRYAAIRAEEEAREAAREAERQARNAQTQYLPGEVGEKVTVTGEVVLDRVIDTQYGSSILLIVKVDEHTSVKMFTTAQWAWDARTEWNSKVEQGDEAPHIVTITGTIKAHEAYQGRKATQLVRVKRNA